MRKLSIATPDYVQSPIDLCKKLSDRQRTERFEYRLHLLRMRPRARGAVLRTMDLLLAEDSSWLLLAPKTYTRARAENEVAARDARREGRKLRTLARQMKDLDEALAEGGSSARRAARLAFELAEWTTRLELGPAAKAWDRQSKRLSEIAAKSSDSGRRQKREREHDRWRGLARDCRLKGKNERAKWIATRAECPDRWRTVRDFLYRESKKVNE